MAAKQNETKAQRMRAVHGVAYVVNGTAYTPDAEGYFTAKAGDVAALMDIGCATVEGTAESEQSA